MRIGLMVIGDELLNGRRKDRHLAHLIDVLQARGREPDWCLMIGDDPAYLTEQLRRTLATPDLVFCFGGIGATPDDHTRQCAARAAGTALRRHSEAAALIERRYGEAAYPYRIRMADLPERARLIPNPVNQIAGFSLGDHHFVPGFPQMAWPMVEWVLETRYPTIGHSIKPVLRTLTIENVPESALIPVMEQLLAQYPGVKISSLPHMAARPWIELGLRGEPQLVGASWAALIRWLDQAGIDYTTGDVLEATGGG